MKKIIIILAVLLFCGCIKKNTYNYQIKTIIEENTNTLIAINYPTSNIKKIDKSIEKYVNNTYNDFLKQYNEITFLNKKHELNIDYTYYNIANKYISVVLFKHISSSDNNLNINEIYNYVYNIKEKTQIKFKDIINENDKNIKDLIVNLLLENYGSIIDMNKLINIDYDNIKFSISNDFITIFFDNSIVSSDYKEIIKIEIPIIYFNKLSNLEKNEIETIQYNEPIINYIDISKPMVALTFDDGPSIYTEEILETLKQYNSNATFFVLGNKIDAHNSTIIKMYQNGNEIGNHSYNHRCLTKLSKIEQVEQINKTQELIKKYTNFTPIYLRPTYGSVNKALRNNTNLDIVLWNIDTRDWKYKDVNKIVDNALKNVKDGSIILMHDTHKRTSDAVKIIIPKLIENGYQLVTISELKKAQQLKNSLNAER